MRGRSDYRPIPRPMADRNECEWTCACWKRAEPKPSIALKAEPYASTMSEGKEAFFLSCRWSWLRPDQMPAEPPVSP
jgi:hypothetical protein